MVEFFCNIPSLKSLTGEVSKVTAWNSYQLMNLMRSKEGEEMQLIINHMGELSGTAQRLRGPITSVERLLQSFQKIYLLTSSIQGRPGHILAQGILKVGQKRLFIRKNGVQLVEMSPLCVLDFYVHESCQRQGLGHMMFEFMLEQEKKRPCQLGYDKPSNKLLSFMAKHYNLKNYNSQANQFVVYNDYFEDAKNEALREKENCSKEPNIMADIGTTLRKEKVIHGRRAYNNQVMQAVDADEQPNFSRPDSRSCLASADERPPSLPSLPQPSFHRGRRNNWQLRQDHSEKATLDSSRNCSDSTRCSPKSPMKAGLPLRDAYRRELNEQGKILQQRRASNSQTEPRKCHETCHRPAGLKSCNEPPRTPPQFSVIGEEERVRIQSLCSPSLAQKMNVTDPTHHLPHFLKPLKPRLGTKPISNKPLSKEPPPPYPFWSEAKAVSSSQHWQEHHPVDYRRSRACC
ncbi:hypothetical protein KC19_9G051500 [Ceratodon purpureus]|uniref:Alpha-tubulin N-acetyltransferase n=1 Tax=Ceratodon purpureus TaxID=3225 RepID=A0A8T0GWH8_CERPU|nr:hypothetical protein KC19_9G051500 [Ceratodon purpureus]